MATKIRSQAAIYARETPAYTVTEAARYLRLPAATLRDWVIGRKYADGRSDFLPIIKPASRQPVLLSFLNLIEGHVLRSLRTDHGVTVKALRQALTYAEKQLGIDHLLLRPDLRTDAGNVLLDKYGQLIDLSASGQLAMRKVLEEHLNRVTYDSRRLPTRLYPFLTSSDLASAHRIAIDPTLAFGRPILLDRAISTSAIAERIDAGEAVDEIAADYELDRSDVEQAVVYERAA